MRNNTITRTYRYSFLVPATAIFTVFYVAPALLGFVLSLTNAQATNLDALQFVGLKNFQTLTGAFSADLLNSVWVQISFALMATLTKTVIGVWLAFLLNRAFRGRAIIRTLVYMPIMFSTIVVGLLFYYILDINGPYGKLVQALGLGGVVNNSLLTDPRTALPTLVAVDVWVGVGWTVIIVLAALQSIPKDVLESAELDGARGAALTFQVKFPFIIHAINLSALLTFIGGMKAFDLIYVMTGSGPAKSTEVMTIFVLKFLQQDNLGFASAVGSIQFLLIVLLALLINVGMRRLEKGSEL